MAYLLLFALLWFTWKGLSDFFTVESKNRNRNKGGKKCKNCGTSIPGDEEFCFYCEIIDYRKWKRDKRMEKNPNAPTKHYNRGNHRARRRR